MQTLSLTWTAVKPQVWDKESTNYCSTAITEVTTISINGKILLEWKPSCTEKWKIYPCIWVAPSCSFHVAPQKNSHIRNSNIVPSLHYNDSNLKMTLAYQIIRTLILRHMRSDQVQPGTHNSCSLPKCSTKQPHFWMKSVLAILQCTEVCYREYKLHFISKFSDIEI